MVSYDFENKEFKSLLIDVFFTIPYVSVLNRELEFLNLNYEKLSKFLINC